MTDVRYAPPQADLGDGPMEAVAAAPPLWNPNAAASWSLLLTPVFGAWLHWKNWQMLGDHERARTAGRWVVAAVAMLFALIGLAAMSEKAAAFVRLLNFAFLIAWYYAAAKPQARFVLGHYGKNYPRRGWALPILVAIDVIFALLFAIGLVAVMLGARA